MASPRIVALIPARGGSKGIPDKNLRSLGSKPLLQWAFEAAKDSGVVERVILSTDSEKIAELGRQIGIEVPFLRPAELAQDDTPMIAVLTHLLNFLSTSGEMPDAIMLLQPTSPLRRAEHLRAAARMLEDHPDADSVVAVTEVPRHYAPSYLMKITPQGSLDYYVPGAETLRRRQDAPAAYSRNGTLYLFRVDSFEKHGDIYGKVCLPLMMSEADTLNLDSQEDWQEAEKIFQKHPQISTPLT